MYIMYFTLYCESAIPKAHAVKPISIMTYLRSNVFYSIQYCESAIPKAHAVKPISIMTYLRSNVFYSILRKRHSKSARG